MADALILTGPHRSDRSNAVDRLVANSWGRVQFVLPTRQAANRRLDRILVNHALPGAWGRPVLSLEDFARSIVTTQTPTIDVMDELDRRLILEDTLAQLPESITGNLPEGVIDTPGFVAHVLRIITQLKQAAVDPDEFALKVAARSKPSWIDPVVSGVYDAYQKALENTTLFDRVGVYWVAANICRTGSPDCLKEIDLIAFDEFDDFTPSEFRLIQALTAARPDVSLVFGLLLDTLQPSMAEVYAIPNHTFQSLRVAFPEATHNAFEESHAATFTEFAASSLFTRDPALVPSGLRPNLTLAPKADGLQEIEHIARQTKKLVLDEGVSPDHIVVAFRNIGDVADTLRGVFHEFGVPAIVAHDPSLTQSAIVSFVLNLLAATTAWPRDAVADALMSPWYQPDNGLTQDQRQWVARLALEAGIVSGRAEWISKLSALQDRLQKQHEYTDHLRRRLPDSHSLLQKVIDEVKRLSNWSDSMPREGRLQHHAAALLASLNLLGLDRGLAQYPVQEIAEPEARALKAFTRILIRLAEWTGVGRGDLDRNAFALQLRQALRLATYALPRPDSGVRCIDLESLRHTPAKYVFIGGANEGSIPRPPSLNAVYSDADCVDLHQAGIAIDSKGEHISREMLQFHHALSSAVEALEITWRLSTRQGKVTAESPFVSDLKSLLGEHLALKRGSTSDFVPPANSIGSNRDWCNVNVVAGQFATVTGCFPMVMHALRIERERQSTMPFGIYDGVIQASELKARLKESYGPGHVFSVSQLETFAECPFAFFLERVLDVVSLEAPESDFDPRVRGMILHRVLELFHKEYAGIGVAYMNKDDAWRSMKAHLHTQFDRYAEMGGTSEGVRTMERLHAEKILQRYLADQVSQRHEVWMPTHFEVGFGRLRGAAATPPGRVDPYVFHTAGDKLLFSGRIDRVDSCQDGLRIVDYKTKLRVTGAKLRDGVNLQLGVYADAMDQYLFPEEKCTEAIYLEIGSDEIVGAHAKSKINVDRLRTIAQEKCGVYVGLIRTGSFPPTSYDHKLPYAHRAHRPCRFDRTRIERKESASS
ncbi:MAG: hypothetical protein AMXMBFR84_33990 [Candidatus Hydrogenedentota bacterium]